MNTKSFLIKIWLYCCAAFFLLLSLVSISAESLFGFFIFLVGTLFILPESRKYIERRLRLEKPIHTLYITVIGIFTLIGGVLSIDDTSSVTEVPVSQFQVVESQAMIDKEKVGEEKEVTEDAQVVVESDEEKENEINEDEQEEKIEAEAQAEPEEVVTTPSTMAETKSVTAAETTTPVTNAPNGTYVNVDGNTVARPYVAPSKPDGATAKCRDGTYSFSQNRSGTCSGHDGVATWY